MTSTDELIRCSFCENPRLPTNVIRKSDRAICHPCLLQYRAWLKPDPAFDRIIEDVMSRPEIDAEKDPNLTKLIDESIKDVFGNDKNPKCFICGVDKETGNIKIIQRKNASICNRCILERFGEWK